LQNAFSCDEPLLNSDSQGFQMTDTEKEITKRLSVLERDLPVTKHAEELI
jgi:hypothetical protein